MQAMYEQGKLSMNDKIKASNQRQFIFVSKLICLKLKQYYIQSHLKDIERKEENQLPKLTRLTFDQILDHDDENLSESEEEYD